MIRMIRIAITPAAFDAIAATLPLGSVGYEAERDAQGNCLVWLDEWTVNKLGALRGPGRRLQPRHHSAVRQAQRGRGDQRASAHCRSGQCPKLRKRSACATVNQGGLSFMLVKVHVVHYMFSYRP